MDTCIRVNEDAFGRKSLGAVTGNGVAVVEMTVLFGVEFDLAVVVEACREPTVLERLPVSESHNLLITVQPQFTVCASLSRVFSARAGAGGTEDFGTATRGQPPPQRDFGLTE